MDDFKRKRKLVVQENTSLKKKIEKQKNVRIPLQNLLKYTCKFLHFRSLYFFFYWLVPKRRPLYFTRTLKKGGWVQGGSLFNIYRIPLMTKKKSAKTLQLCHGRGGQILIGLTGKRSVKQVNPSPPFFLCFRLGILTLKTYVEQKDDMKRKIYILFRSIIF